MKTHTQADIDSYKVTRNGEILQWCKDHRPDIVHHMERILAGETDNPEATAFLVAIVFAAGREFQHLNPDVSIHQPI